MFQLLLTYPCRISEISCSDKQHQKILHKKIFYHKLGDKKENDVLLANGVDKGIAGLIAAINLIGVEGVILSGKNTQSALDKYNPAFKKNSPNIYANLGKINFVKKANGIITIMTENGDDIQIDKIKVKNKANISISTMPAGNLQFDVLSGIKVGKNGCLVRS